MCFRIFVSLQPKHLHKHSTTVIHSWNVLPLPNGWMHKWGVHCLMLMLLSGSRDKNNTLPLLPSSGEEKIIRRISLTLRFSTRQHSQENVLLKPCLCISKYSTWLHFWTLQRTAFGFLVPKNKRARIFLFSFAIFQSSIITLMGKPV